MTRIKVREGTGHYIFKLESDHDSRIVLSSTYLDLLGLVAALEFFQVEVELALSVCVGITDSLGPI